MEQAWSSASIQAAITGCVVMNSGRGSSNPRDPERAGLTLDIVRTLSAPAVSILVAGIARGEIREDAKVVELASMTTELVLGRASAMPGFSIEPTIEFVQEVVFDGVGVSTVPDRAG